MTHNPQTQRVHKWVD